MVVYSTAMRPFHAATFYHITPPMKSKFRAPYPIFLQKVRVHSNSACRRAEKTSRCTIGSGLFKILAEPVLLAASSSSHTGKCQ